MAYARLQACPNPRAVCEARTITGVTDASCMCGQKGTPPGISHGTGAGPYQGIEKRVESKKTMSYALTLEGV